MAISTFLDLYRQEKPDPADVIDTLKAHVKNDEAPPVIRSVMVDIISNSAPLALELMECLEYLRMKAVRLRKLGGVIADMHAWQYEQAANSVAEKIRKQLGEFKN